MTGEKFGSKGAGTLGRERRIFMAAVGIAIVMQEADCANIR
jgi:hypothetical protein